MAPIMLDPWGVPSPSEVDSFEHPGFDGIKTIVISHGGVIDSILVQYARGGNDVWVERVGGPGGGQRDQIKLDYPHEYLRKMEGHYGRHAEKTVIKSLTLYSNRKTYGPYGSFGERDGTSFGFGVRGAMITGFHGDAGTYVERLGVFLEPIDHNPPNERLEELFCDMHSFLQQRFEHLSDRIAQKSSPEQPLNCPDMKSSLRVVWNVVMRGLGLAPMLDSTESTQENVVVHINNV